MRPLLGIVGIVGGFVVSLGMFGGGLALATYLIAVEPGQRPGPSRDVADLWTDEPRTVDTAAQDLERVPARPLPSPPNSSVEKRMAGTAASELAPGFVDSVTTGSVQADQRESKDWQAPSERLSAAHVEWCADRYRSYRPQDNSYTTYGGELRPCVSPFMDDPAVAEAMPVPAPEAAQDTASDEEFGDVEFLGDPSEVLRYASDEPAGLAPEGMAWAASDHVSYCFSRYRSYRPEDNTYQPYGGGPRRQCH